LRRRSKLSRGRTRRGLDRHALPLTPVWHVITPLAIDFDSTRNRADLFRDNPMSAGKIVLLDRIKWFPAPKSAKNTRGSSGIAVTMTRQ